MDIYHWLINAEVFNCLKCFQKREFYIAAAGGAAYQNFAHIQKTIQVWPFFKVNILCDKENTNISTFIRNW